MNAATATIEVLLCATCSAAHLEAPSGRCPGCGSAELTATPLAPTGHVVSATTVRLAPPGVEVPYVIAYADFEPGARLIGRSETALEIGHPVRIAPVGDPVERFRFAPEEAGR